MLSRRLVAPLAFGFALAASAASDDFARGLAPGMSLTYESEGVAHSPWRIDSLHFNAAAGGRTDVTRIILRLGEDAPPTRRVYAIDREVLRTWDAASNQWRAQRPLVPRRTLEVPQANGDTTRVVTGDASTIPLGGKQILVIPTTFDTRNRAGRPVRRLTEQYAPALATAVTGVFEVADSATGVWRVTQRFRLVAIK